ncbi:MAG: hypothetical protein VR77_05865 [Flavobacteriales bacterium BRH_c54]|nr:MAG: hypothetical protein VR77_05865 [Flavobacteriales bacterium BRH_c54]
MKKKTIDYFMFIKISNDKFIDSLQQKGHIYCNSIKYFRTIEDNGIRGDKNEGKAYLKQVKDFEISLEGKVIAKAEKAQIYFDHPEDIGNLFCLYGVQSSLVNLTKKSLQKIKIENQSKKFGQSALLIHNPEEFINRISKELKRLSKEFNFSLVHYFDPETYEGELSPFYKSNKYEYQNEVRFWIPQNEERTFEFYIGDISDISHKIPIGDLDKIEVEVIKPAHNSGS